MPRVKKAPPEAGQASGVPGEADAGTGRMSGVAFARLRAALGKSQRELSELLGLSLKAVESYEQGWRKVPAHVERLLYFLLFKLNEDDIEEGETCWESKDCPDSLRSRCVAFVAKEGRFCWFFTGRLCTTAKPDSGGVGTACYTCSVFTSMLSKVDGGMNRCQ
jgi:hypothetical protein